jgi:hypothetical protein
VHAYLLSPGGSYSSPGAYLMSEKLKVKIKIQEATDSFKKNYKRFIFKLGPVDLYHL